MPPANTPDCAVDSLVAPVTDADTEGVEVRPAARAERRANNGLREALTGGRTIGPIDVLVGIA